MTTELMELCEELLAKYGEHAQTLKFFGEVAEAQVAICHFGEGKSDNKDVVSELVDVFITLTGMLLIHDKDEELFGIILKEKMNKARTEYL